jgi:signal transduction histidine kinase
MKSFPKDCTHRGRAVIHASILLVGAALILVNLAGSDSQTPAAPQTIELAGLPAAEELLPVNRLTLLSAAFEAEQLAEANNQTADIDFFELSVPPDQIPECQHQLAKAFEKTGEPLSEDAANPAGLLQTLQDSLILTIGAGNLPGWLCAALVAEMISPHLWQWCLISLAIILSALAILTFEQYRAARIRELNAALSESEALTEQLTLQQMEIGKAYRTLALDYAVTRVLVEAVNPKEAALEILQTICLTTGWDVGAIWEVDPQSNIVCCVGVWQHAGSGAAEFDDLNGEVISLPGTGLPGRVLASRQSQWLSDMGGAGGYWPAAAITQTSLQSGFGFPIMSGSEVIGILELYSQVARQPDDELAQIMSTMGSHVGQLLQRKRAEDALSKSKEEHLLELQRVRRRIATDLHDDVGSSLTKIALLSEAVRQKVTEKNKEACDRLSTVTSITNELVETMSDIVWAINPQKDNLSDLSQRMRRFASDIFTARQIAFRFRAPAGERDTMLGANVRREVFLIFKESVNNVMKHSDCSEVVLDLSISNGWLALSITDNGKGFDPQLVKADTGYLTSQFRGGNGLASMRRRARELGGQFEVITSKGRGATVSLRLPVGRALSAGI